MITVHLQVLESFDLVIECDNQRWLYKSKIIEVM